jgi:hypothetical protein
LTSFAFEAAKEHGPEAATALLALAAQINQLKGGTATPQVLLNMAQKGFAKLTPGLAGMLLARISQRAPLFTKTAPAAFAGALMGGALSGFDGGAVAGLPFPEILNLPTSLLSLLQSSDRAFATKLLASLGEGWIGIASPAVA